MARLINSSEFSGLLQEDKLLVINFYDFNDLRKSVYFFKLVINLMLPFISFSKIFEKLYHLFIFSNLDYKNFFLTTFKKV